MFVETSILAVHLDAVKLLRIPRNPHIAEAYCLAKHIRKVFSQSLAQGFIVIRETLTAHHQAK